MGPEIQSVQQRAHRFRRQSDTIAAVVNDLEYTRLISHPAVEVFPDVQLQPLTTWTRGMSPMAAITGLPDVLQSISAPTAWNKSRGKDTYIAIVDTGVCGTMLEFPDWKKANGWSFDGSDPWEDYYGHGSMCACIAAGTDAGGGRFNGVAPDAKLYSCKTQFFTSELIDIYEWLIDRRDEHDQPIIASNSYGFYSCADPQEDGHPITINHPFVTIVQQAIAAGITVVFAAGNNHADCDGAPDQCQPNTIWVWNSLDEVLSVGTVDENNNLWDYSSRGPGQWTPAERPKPDCVAPTYGEVMWDCGYSNMTNGWGTSGAAPQAAGLAALLASQRPNDPPATRLDRIRQSCDAHPTAATCSGHGVINCANAVY
jgi:subtilisin family serine protease